MLCHLSTYMQKKTFSTASKAGMTSLRGCNESFDVMVLNGSEEVIPAKAGTHCDVFMT